MNNGIILLVILAVYFIVLLLIGRFSGGKSDDNENFFLAGKSSPWWLVAIGMVGTSISGVTFISVPGMPLTIDMTYMQTVLGFVVGYIVIAKILLPLYYRLELTSIYTYLERRFGICSYKTGALFFFISQDNRGCRPSLSCRVDFTAHRVGRLEYTFLAYGIDRCFAYLALFTP